MAKDVFEIPQYYVVYLLKSQISTAVYIGSTPNPLRRIRQHNGEISAGAKRTTSYRPWHMELYIHGFPSKIAALQFEWVWQNIHTSRLIKDPSTNQQMFIKSQKNKRSKLAYLRAMLGSAPFKHWALKIRFFSDKIADEFLIFENYAALSPDELKKSKQFASKRWTLEENKVMAIALPNHITWVTDLGGVDGNRAIRRQSTPGINSDGAIDITDYADTEASWAQWCRLLSHHGKADFSCSVCQNTVNQIDHKSFVLCPDLQSSCLAVAHVECMAQIFLKTDPQALRQPNKIMPAIGTCPKCGRLGHWQTMIKAAMRRAQVRADGAIVQRGSSTDDSSESDESEIEDEMEANHGPNQNATSPCPSRSQDSGAESASSRSSSFGLGVTKAVPLDSDDDSDVEVISI